MKKLLATTVVALTAMNTAMADVGMWIPTLMGKIVPEMQRHGLKLTAEDIYSVNHASLKDAVVMFGGGCTGEFVSDEGLLLTNHHCGYEYIQYHSSVEHNYLADGFWAMNRNEELPCPDLSVSLLEYIEDVTDSILVGTDTISDLKARRKAIVARMTEMEKRLTQDSRVAEVNNTYGGNQYLLYVYQVYKDVRMVGAPPSEIGKFGGDTDNWVWPRHTGDFSIFRVYADKDNNPAKYSADNVPYRPKQHLKISTKGVSESDFAMVMGYPGSTRLYSPASYIKYVQDYINPRNVELRTAKLEVMNRYQAMSEKVDIQYAAKNAHTSNAWKKWQGEIRGLQKTDAIRRLQQREAQLRQRSAECAVLLDEYENIYNEDYALRSVCQSYYSEVVRRGGVELVDMLYPTYQDKENPVKPTFDRDFDYALSSEMAAAVMTVYCKNVPKDLWPASLQKWKGTPKEYMYNMYKKSALADSVKLNKLLSHSDWLKRLDKDPATRFYFEMLDVRDAIAKHWSNVPSNEYINDVNRRYIKAVGEAYPDSVLPPDANFTMRISYGNVAGYKAEDAVKYDFFTTLDGIMEKHRTGNPDFSLPQRLIDLYEQKAYAPYADPTDGKLHTAFVSTCHTTGGNSGSPVLNANGELIGLNFDRAWNGVMSDMFYDPSICRNITLDIRYLLFIVDKYAGAEHLIKEMLK